MKSNRYHYARRMRQLRYALKRMEQMRQNGQSLSTARAAKLKARLLRLYHQLKEVLNPVVLRRVLAGSALALGITMTASAQPFAAPVNNPFNIDTPTGIMLATFVDIDNDGDTDILSSNYQEYSTNYFSLNFYENVGNSSNPDFSSPTQNPFGFNNNYISAPSFVDIDNDGDLDMFAGGLGYIGTIFYSENTGTPGAPAFSAVTSNPFNSYLYQFFSFVDAGDFDNDGDYDLMASSNYGTFYYFENVGTAMEPDFAASVTNPFGLDGLTASIAKLSDWADFDGDGDLDLIFQDAYYNTALTYIENTGTPNNPNFGVPQNNPFGLTFNAGYETGQPAFGDIDSDGDIDIFVNIWYSGNLQFFENTAISNAAPTSSSFEVTTQENNVYSFAESDFSFNDVDGGTFTSVEITTLPTAGALEVGGLPIPAGAIIEVADLNTMTFAPFANEFGAPYTSFEFRVSDGISFSVNTYMVIINVEENTATVERLDEMAVQLSPNPATAGLLLEANLDTPVKDGSIHIINPLGQVVRTFALEQGSTKVQQWIDLQGLSAGNYFLELEADQAFWTGRFHKQ